MQTIPAGTAGTRATLSIMRRLVREGKINPLVRQTAVDVTTGLLQKDRLAEIKALHRFVRDRIRYVRDIHGVETLHTAEKVLQNKAGDCDDKTILLASLLESLGYTTRLVAVGFSDPVKNLFGQLQAKNYSHVYPEVFYKGKWIPLETTEPVEIGWFPKNAKSAIVLHNGDNVPKMFGLAGKRVKAAMAAESAKLVAARAAAAAADATPEMIAAAATTQEEYDAMMASHAAARVKKKQKAIKKWGIIATIVSVVVGVFTFGAGGAVLESAFQAIKQGAITVAKSLLLAAAASAAKKGASKKDVAAAQQAANDLEKYPPDKNLPSLDAMIESSQAKKQQAQTTAVMLPIAAVTAFSMFT